VKEEDYTIALATCSRCGTPLEYAIFPQWWLRMKPLAEEVLRGLERDEIAFVPERWKKVNMDWLRNVRDWNISRQLWWGHQIPAWYCQGLRGGQRAQAGKLLGRPPRPARPAEARV
jgi:valyl-tRNA synthetase